MIEKEIIDRCRKGDPKAQKLLYERLAPKMFGVCKRYIKRREQAEDVLLQGMFKVLSKINSYSGVGSFEGWTRRIIVNEALMSLRKKNNFNLNIEISHVDLRTEVSIIDELAAQDILDLLDCLPTGYRTIFNLYVIEGYKHREIAEQLDISIHTSKSQLIRAKERLRELIEKKSEIINPIQQSKTN